MCNSMFKRSFPVQRCSRISLLIPLTGNKRRALAHSNFFIKRRFSQDGEYPIHISRAKSQWEYWYFEQGENVKSVFVDSKCWRLIYWIASLSFSLSVSRVFLESFQVENTEKLSRIINCSAKMFSWHILWPNVNYCMHTHPDIRYHSPQSSFHFNFVKIQFIHYHSNSFFHNGKMYWLLLLPFSIQTLYVQRHSPT